MSPLTQTFSQLSNRRTKWRSEEGEVGAAHYRHNFAINNILISELKILTISTKKIVATTIPTDSNEHVTFYYIICD